MREKGFTLVELLGTIVVLGIILTISIPSIVETVRKANVNEAEAYLVRLFNASETYIELNRRSFDQLKTVGGRVDIPIDYLIDEGLIRELGVDPTSGNTITEDWTVVATTQSDKTIEYTLYDENTNINSYVQDGLILHLDSINNFGIGHSNTTTVWNDMSGQNNGARLMNFGFDSSSGWVNNGLKFDGINDIAVTDENDYDFSTFVATIPFSYSAFFTTNTLQTWMGVLTNMTTWTNGFNMQYGEAQRIGVGGTTYLSNSTLPTINTRYHVTAAYDGVTMRLYINGVWVNQANLSYNQGNKHLTIGAFYDTPSLLSNATIHSVMFYDKTLNSTEILNNYNLDTVRYR